MEIDKILELYADKIKEINYELISFKDGKLHFYNNKKEKEITIDSNNVYSIKRLTKEEQNVFFNIFEELTETVKKNNLQGGQAMTVRDLIKRLEKIDKDKMCIHREFKDSIGWSNLEIKEKENEVTFYGDMSRPFSDEN